MVDEAAQVQLQNEKEEAKLVWGGEKTITTIAGGVSRYKLIRRKIEN